MINKLLKLVRYAVIFATVFNVDYLSFTKSAFGPIIISSQYRGPYEWIGMNQQPKWLTLFRQNVRSSLSCCINVNKRNKSLHFIRF